MTVEWLQPRPQQRSSCSTFLLSRGDTLLVGHNLDEYCEVPGLVVVNKRGMAKENIGFFDLLFGPSRRRPRLRWMSRYGSITYNTVGQEFIDGGLNEAGLYVGEMTLLGTRYPQGRGLPRFYHHQWMQYLLDNFSTVDEVLADLSRTTVDGHCQWHFFIADRQSNAAVIEFLQGQAVVHAHDDLAIPFLGNASHADDMERLRAYQGFGGSRPVDPQDRDHRNRIVWAATMLRDFPGEPPGPAVDYAFALLQQLDCGNSKWSIVYDIPAMRMYFHTYRARTVRYVDIAAFDLAGAPALALDIHQDLAGDVARRFAPVSQALQAEYVGRFFAATKAAWGFPANVTLVPRLRGGMARYPEAFPPSTA